MALQYTVEAEVDNSRIYATYRLQNDGSWRRTSPEGEPVIGKDRVFLDPLKTLRFTEEEMKIVLDGEEYTAKSIRYGFLEYSREATVKPRLHREEKPKPLSKKSLIRAIVKGDDSRDNRLVSLTTGNFILVNAAGFIYPRNHPYIAVRHNRFYAGKGYVGEKAARDEEYIEDLWLSMLSGWAKHIETGELGVLSDEAPRLSEHELLREIDACFPPKPKFPVPRD